MRALFVTLFIISCNFAVAQEQIYFNKNYPLEWEYDANNMVIVDSTYYLSGNIARTTPECEYNLYGYHITKIRWDGERDTTKIYDECNKANHIGWQGSLVYNNYISTCGLKYYNDTMSSIFFSSFDIVLDTLNSYNLMPNTLTKRALGLFVDKSNLNIIYGGIDSTYNEQTELPDTTYSKALFIKVNNIGNIILSKSFSWGNISDGCWSILTRGIPDYQNNYYFIGVSRDLSTNKKPIILKTDSLGNEEWVHAYGSNTYSNPRFMDIIETRDSSILLCGAYAIADGGAGIYPYHGWLLKLNPDGTSVWNKKYRIPTMDDHPEDTIYAYFKAVTELSNGNIAVAANTRMTPASSRMNPSLYVMNSVGDTLFSKHYIYPVGFSEQATGNLYVNAIEETYDSGLAISGYGEFRAYDSVDNNWYYDQRIFLIKTDSLGNDSLSYISEPQANPISRYELEVYPNPGSNQLYINLPANFPGGDMQIINQQGQIVNTIHLPRHEHSPAEINVSSYPPGHYLIQIKTNGNYFYGKFMKN